MSAVCLPTLPNGNVIDCDKNDVFWAASKKQSRPRFGCLVICPSAPPNDDKVGEPANCILLVSEEVLEECAGKASIRRKPKQAIKKVCVQAVA